MWLKSVFVHKNESNQNIQFAVKLSNSERLTEWTSELRRVFDLENDLYALWSHSKEFLSVCVSYLFVCAGVYLKLYADFLCSAPEIEDSPENEPELRSVFLVLCGLQTNSVSLTVREDALGPAAVCSGIGITRGLWSHRATAHFAGKKQDDVMLLAQQHTLIRCAMGEKGWGTDDNNKTSMMILCSIILIINLITVKVILIICICTRYISTPLN